MIWRKENLDVVLVLSGLSIMSAYHVFLLHRYKKDAKKKKRDATKTVIFYEQHNREHWVKNILREVDAKDRSFAISVINGTISAATFLASTSLALSSLIGALISSSSHNIFTSILIYGNRSEFILSVKYVSLLICFLVAFGSFFQCVMNFVDANFLISMPNKGIPEDYVDYVLKAVRRGSTCWIVGLRAIYFATTLLLWIFGPIPMFAASVIMVIVLHILDTNKTELHKFQTAKSHNLFRKIGEAITAEARAFEHPERSQGGGSKTSGGQQ